MIENYYRALFELSPTDPLPERPEEPDAEASLDVDVDIKAPGVDLNVDVKVGADVDVDVKAPGVDLDVDVKVGADVDVDVKISADLDVDTPTVDDIMAEFDECDPNATQMVQYPDLEKQLGEVTQKHFPSVVELLDKLKEDGEMVWERDDFEEKVKEWLDTKVDARMENNILAGLAGAGLFGPPPTAEAELSEETKLEKEIAAAGAAGEYKKAGELQEELAKLKKKTGLQVKIDAAKSSSDFEQAAQLQKEMDILTGKRQADKPMLTMSGSERIKMEQVLLLLTVCLKLSVYQRASFIVFVCIVFCVIQKCDRNGRWKKLV